MKKGIILISIACAIALSTVLWDRLSDDAIAVIVGAMCGISASIPIVFGLALMWVRDYVRKELVSGIKYNYVINRFSKQTPMEIYASQYPMITEPRAVVCGHGIAVGEYCPICVRRIHD